MATIYLTEQGTTLYKSHLRFIVQVSGAGKIEIPIREVDRVLVFGSIQLTTQAIDACLAAGILVLYLGTSGQYRGHLWSLAGTNLNNEFIQFSKANDLDFQINVCRSIVFGKLSNSKQLLLRLNRKRKVAEVAKAIAGISLDIQALDEITDIDRLRGYEGIGAARYFPAFGKLIANPNFTFEKRFRQPPTDPVNSLLSFGYTLLFNNVLSLLIAEGLSPYIGNFHYGEDRKPYLAFDSMEEFRSPIVDSLVLRAINNSCFKVNDFEKSKDGGVYLNEAARKVFLKQFEAQMNVEVSHPDLQSPVSYRQAIQLQVRRYKRCLASSFRYEPFIRPL